MASKKIDSLLKMLTLVCSACKMKFNVMKEYQSYKFHKAICIAKSSLLLSSSSS